MPFGFDRRGSAARPGGGAQRVGESAVHEQRRVDAVREVAQLLHRFLEIEADLVEHRLGLLGIGVGDLAGEPHTDRERDEVLLRAVVQVAFDAAAFGVGGFDDAGADRRSSSAWRRTASSDSCSAESSFTLWSASPTWRASSVSARSSASLNGSAPCARRTTIRPSSSPEFVTGAVRSTGSSRPVRIAGSHTCAHAGPETPACATTVSSSGPSGMTRRPWSGTDTARSMPSAARVHTSATSRFIVAFSDSASWSSSSSRGSARVRRLPNVRSTSSGA